MFTAHKNLLNAFVAAALVLGASASAPASAGTYFSVGWSAPAPRVEVRQAAPGPNYTWVAGRWQWTAWTGWQWHRGFWEFVAPTYYRPAPAYYYAPTYGQVREREEHREAVERYDRHVNHEAANRDARRDGNVRR